YLFVYQRSRSDYFNFTINTTQHSLANRHRIVNNIKTTVLLMPTVVMHGLIYAILSAAIAYYGIAYPDQGNATFGIDYVLVVNTIAILEAASHPVMLIVRHEHLTKAASKYLPFLKIFIHNEENHKVATLQSSQIGASTANGAGVNENRFKRNKVS